MSKSKKTQPKASTRKIVITREDICATHFANEQLDSDMFYVNLANKIYPDIRKFVANQTDFDPETSKRLAIVIACHIEDIVAGSGVWEAFSSLCKKKYKKELPFYDLEEYADFSLYDAGSLNFHAVLFLIWYVFNDYKPGVFINPTNPGIFGLAMSLMPDLIEAYEEAPDTAGRPVLINPLLPPYYMIRELCAWLSNQCYLTRIHNREKDIKYFKDFAKRIMCPNPDEDEDRLAYCIGSFVPMNVRIGPLGIPAYEWLAEIVRIAPEPDEEEYIRILDEMKSLPYDIYRYVSVGEDELVLEDADGKKYTLTAASFPDKKIIPDIKPGKSAMLSIVYFDGVWVMNGVGINGMPGEAFDEHRERHLKNEEERKASYKYLLKALKKKRIGVCSSYEEYLKLANGDYSPEDRSDPELTADVRSAVNLVYFLNSNGMVSILPNWAGCIKIKGNPYYDKEQATEEGVALIMDQTLASPELREYLIDKKLIPDAALNSFFSIEDGRQLFQENIRFLNDYAGRDSMPFVADE